MSIKTDSFFISGKLYEYISNKHEERAELICIEENKVGQTTTIGIGSGTTYRYPKGQIFLFVEEIAPFTNIKMSKILIDDKVLVTYDCYLLKDLVQRVVKVDTKEANSNG